MDRKMNKGTHSSNGSPLSNPEALRKMEQGVKKACDTVKGMQGAGGADRQASEEMLDQIANDLDRLNERSAEITAELGMSEQELERYIDNPNNFTLEECAALERAKEKIKTAEGADPSQELQKNKKVNKKAKNQWIAS